MEKLETNYGAKWPTVWFGFVPLAVKVFGIGIMVVCNKTTEKTFANQLV